MTTPYGSGEPQFDLCKLAVTAGATYVARWTPNRSIQAIRSIKTALQHSGFSMVELITQCPTHYGRYALGTGKPDEMLKWIEKSSVSLAQAGNMTPDELDGKFVLGEFINVKRPVFEGTTVYNAGVSE
jgi:2-oxoglutarate ferredoxin oxidoreductase subunit beta